MEESARIIREKRPEYGEETVDQISRAVASSSIRFNIVKINANKPLTFKWSEALNFEGDSAPFIMYSYAGYTAPGKNMNFADNMDKDIWPL